MVVQGLCQSAPKLLSQGLCQSASIMSGFRQTFSGCWHMPEILLNKLINIWWDCSCLFPFAAYLIGVKCLKRGLNKNKVEKGAANSTFIEFFLSRMSFFCTTVSCMQCHLGEQKSSEGKKSRQCENGWVCARVAGADTGIVCHCYGSTNCVVGLHQIGVWWCQKKVFISIINRNWATAHYYTIIIAG